MGTHCLIAAKMADGTYKSSYCHYDGYPEGALAMLTAHYSTTRKARQLAKLGYISGVCSTYKQTKKEAANVSTAGQHTSLDGLDSEARRNYCQYLYVYENGKWNYHFVSEKLRWTR